MLKRSRKAALIALTTTALCFRSTVFNSHSSDHDNNDIFDCWFMTSTQLGAVLAANIESIMLRWEGGRWEVAFFWWNFTRFYCQVQEGALYTKVFKKRWSVQTHDGVHSVHVVSGAFSRPTPGHSIWHGEILPQIKSHSLIFVLRTSGQKRCISKS